MEIFKDIEGYEGRYQVSNLGRVKSFLRGKETIRKPCIDGWGYCMVSMYKDGGMKMRKIHRLVIASFVGPSDLDVNHKNGDKKDNRLENLEYCTQSQNTKHMYDVLGHKAKSGIVHHKARLNTKQIELIRADQRTLMQIAADYNCHYTTIHYIKTKRSRKHE